VKYQDNVVEKFDIMCQYEITDCKCLQVPKAGNKVPISNLLHELFTGKMSVVR
jgi:hypothetical protein